MLLARLTGRAELAGEVYQEHRSCWRGWLGAANLLARLTGSTEVAGEVVGKTEVPSDSIYTKKKVLTQKKKRQTPDLRPYFALESRKVRKSIRKTAVCNVKL